MNERQTPELDDDYYIANFHTIASHVADHYQDLLTHTEKSWLDVISRVSIPAQCLYIRLLNRRGSTFRLNRLHYAEIPCIGHAADELIQRALGHDKAPVDWPVLLSCFTKPELLDVLELRSLRHLSRVDLISHVTHSAPELQIRFKGRLQAADRWITLEGHHHWMLMQLCFFGNLYQDSSVLVLQQLGASNYEDYPLDVSSRAFTSREQIDAHWRYFEAEALFDCINPSDAGKLIKLVNSLPDACTNDVNLQRRLDRIRNRIARQLERLSLLDEAKVLYEQSIHPPARERRVRIMMTRLEWQDALLVARQMHDKPYNEAERLTGYKLLCKCQQALGIKYKKHRIFKPATTRLVLRDNAVRVEESARRYYADKGACFYTENTLINAVFGLFIWDIIFHPVPAAFFNPYQAAPADFYEPEFLARRTELFKARFEELDDQTHLGARVLKAYQLHQGKQNPLVRWQGLSAQMLALAIDRIPQSHWRSLFERILVDMRENTKGFPDLILFPQEGGYEFIEIKGPGDTLQANQRRWMHYFDQHGIACRLVHVRYRRDEPTST